MQSPSMASATAKPPKRLGEFLKEQQEPFVPEVYLLERWHSKKWSFTPQRGSGYSYGDSGTSLERSAGSCLNKKLKALLPFSRVLTALCEKLAFHNESSISRDFDENNEDIRTPEICRVDQTVEKTDRFSSASSSTVFNSCSEIDEEDAYHPPISSNNCQAPIVRKIGVESQQATKNGKQRQGYVRDGPLSPSKMPSQRVALSQNSCWPDDTVRQNIGRTEQRARSCGVLLPKKITEDSLLSAALWGLLIQSAKRESCPMKLRELLGPNVSQIMKSKRVLQKTKKLLFDCVREIAVTLPRKDEGHQGHRQLWGPEEPGKVLCENTKEWRGRQARDGTNLTYLLNLDYLNSVNEWSDFEPHMKHISFEIADAILDCINDEIVYEIIDNFGTS